MPKRFKMQKRGGDAEILIYDTIGEDFWGGVSSKTFYNDLKALGSIKTLNVRINSEGGNLFEGFAIYNQIKSADAERRVVTIDALAASAASLIAMAGDEIRIAKNAWIMVHNPFGFAMGDYRDFDEQALLLRQLTDTVAETYEARTNVTAEQAREMMDAETWMAAEPAIENGFADQEVEQMAVAAKLNLSRWPHAPQALVRRADPDVIPAKLASMAHRLDKVIGKN